MRQSPAQDTIFKAMISQVRYGPIDIIKITGIQGAGKMMQTMARAGRIRREAAYSVKPKYYRR